MNAQPHIPPKHSNSSQLDLPQLVSRANCALDAGQLDDAIHYLRAAVQRAPLRTDLRESLFAAIEQRKSSRGASSGPRPLRQPTQPPLFDNPMHDEEAPARIEEVPSPRKKASSVKSSPSEKTDLFGPSDFSGERPALAKSQSRSAAQKPPRPARKLGEGRSRIERQSVGSLFNQPHPRRSISPARVAAVLASVMLVFGCLAAGIFFVSKLRRSEANADSDEPKLSQAQRDDAVLLARAEDYLKERQYTLAFEQIERMSEGADRARLLAQTYGLQAEEFFSGKRYEEAGRVYAKAADAEPNNDLWHFQVGWCSYMMGLEKRVTNRAMAQTLFDQAEAAFKAAIHINPDQVKALHGLGKIEVARNNRPSANEYYQKILQIAPDSPEAILARGDLEAWGLERSRSARETAATNTAGAETVEVADKKPDETAESPKVKTEMTSLKSKL